MHHNMSTVRNIALGGEVRGTKVELAHKWADWLHNPCRLGGRSQVLQSGRQSQKWPSNGQIGHITHAVWGVPNASEWTISNVPQMGGLAT